MESTNTQLRQHVVDHVIDDRVYETQYIREYINCTLVNITLASLLDVD